MKVRLLAASGLCLVLGGGVVASPATAQEKKEQKIKLKERDGAFIQRVNKAVINGVEFLKKAQLPDGAWKSHFDQHLHGSWRNGITAFCLFTLLKAGVMPTDPVCEKSFKYLKESWDNFKAGGMTVGEPTSWKNYEVSCMLMALAAKYEKPTAFVHSIQSGTPLAGWGGIQAGKLRRRPDRADLVWVNELAKWLHDNLGMTEQSSNGSSIVRSYTTWSYPSANKDAQKADRSNTQFAVLGLQAADNLLRKAGQRATTDSKLWADCLKNFIAYQDKKPEKVVPRVIPFKDKKNPGYIRYKTVGSISNRARGWAYYTGQHVDRAGDEWTRPIGSMVCVGISVVAICMEQLQMHRKLSAGDRKDAATAIRDGLAWLEIHYKVDEHPGHEPAQKRKYHYYYLYGMERACVSADTPLIGVFDWYGDGAEFILQNQTGEGCWYGDVEGQIPTTCFSLLFLTKGTVPPNIGVKISGH